MIKFSLHRLVLSFSTLVLLLSLLFFGCRKSEDETEQTTTSQQFINYTVNGTPYSFTDVEDSILIVDNGLAFTLRVNGNRVPDNGNYATFLFDRIAISPGTYQHLWGFSVNQIPANASINAPIFLAVTEVGATGEFISGNFSGSYTGPPPTSTVYNITCNFRIKRIF